MKAEFAAFRARLEEHPILAGKVFPIVRKNGDEAVRANYVVAKSSKPDRLDDARFTAVSVFESDRRFTYDVRGVVVLRLGSCLMWRRVTGMTGLLTCSTAISVSGSGRGGRDAVSACEVCGWV